MAVLGLQVVFSMITFSFLHKLSCFYSFGRWLVVGRLHRYLHPTDEELRALSGVGPATRQGATPRQGATTRQGRHRKNAEKPAINKNEPFTVPRNIPLDLTMSPIQTFDFVQLEYYPEYQWLMDYSICATFVYIITELYLGFSAQRPDVNLSVCWCLLAICFCMRILFMNLMLYIKSEDGGERILVLTFALFFFVLAMIVLIVDNDTLEFNLEHGYMNMSGNALIFMRKQGIFIPDPTSFMSFRILLAFVCSFIGAMMTFPGLRLARMHLDALKYSSEQPMLRILLHTSFILPVFYLLLWVKPIGREMFCKRQWRASTVLMGDDVFEMFRLSFITLIVILRFSLLTTYLQAYLNLAYDRIQNIRKQSGRITNTEIKNTIVRIFYYLCVVALQYIAPVILMLFVMFLSKTLGDYSWGELVGVHFPEVPISSPVEPVQDSVAANETMDTISSAVSEFSWAFANIRLIFTSVWYRGLLSFLSWWLCVSSFITTTFGIFYYVKVSE